MRIETIPTQTHERVLSCTDTASGLRAFIALHDTTLGPGLGGCRMWRYETTQEALADVLRLSAGMTAKSALAGVPFGGGKAVIMGDSRTEKSPEKLRAFGRFLETLKGDFITGEDVGMSPADIAIIAEETQHVSGLPAGKYASGDPSPVTAAGVFLCMQAAAEKKFGSGRLDGRTVAVQGLGHVGMVLANRLSGAGAHLVAADVDPAATRRAATELGARIVPPEDILDAKVEIFAPCALGGILNADTAPRLRASIVCGSANNQLADRDCAETLFSRNVLYCPDYVVNSGGLINVAREVLKIEGDDWVAGKLDAAVETFRELLAKSDQDNRPPLDIADEMVARIVSDAKSRRHLNAS